MADGSTACCQNELPNDGHKLVCAMSPLCLLIIPEWAPPLMGATVDLSNINTLVFPPSFSRLPNALVPHITSPGSHSSSPCPIPRTPAPAHASMIYLFSPPRLPPHDMPTYLLLMIIDGPASSHKAAPCSFACCMPPSLRTPGHWRSSAPAITFPRMFFGVQDALWFDPRTWQLGHTSRGRREVDVTRTRSKTHTIEMPKVRAHHRGIQRLSLLHGKLMQGCMARPHWLRTALSNHTHAPRT